MNNTDKTRPVSPQWVWVRMSDGTVRRHFLNIGYVVHIQREIEKKEQENKQKS